MSPPPEALNRDLFLEDHVMRHEGKPDEHICGDRSGLLPLAMVNTVETGQASENVGSALRHRVDKAIIAKHGQCPASGVPGYLVLLADLALGDPGALRQLASLYLPADDLRYLAVRRDGAGRIDH
jgi:hypothetical protein